MSTIVSLFGLPTLMLVVIIVARVVKHVTTPRQPDLSVVRGATQRPPHQDGAELPSIGELVTDPSYRYFPGNAFRDDAPDA